MANKLKPQEKKKFDSIVDKAEGLQSSGKLMFKDIQRLKKKYSSKTPVISMPSEFTQNVTKSLNAFLARKPEDRTIMQQLGVAEKEIIDLIKTVNKEYTQIKKSGGFLPERNIPDEKMAVGGKVYSKTQPRKVGSVD